MTQFHPPASLCLLLLPPHYKHMHAPRLQSSVFLSSFSICCLSISKTPRMNLHLCSPNLPQTSQRTYTASRAALWERPLSTGSGMYLPSTQLHQRLRRPDPSIGTLSCLSPWTMELRSSSPLTPISCQQRDRPTWLPVSSPSFPLLMPPFSSNSFLSLLKHYIDSHL